MDLFSPLINNFNLNPQSIKNQIVFSSGVSTPTEIIKTIQETNNFLPVIKTENSNVGPIELEVKDPIRKPIEVDLPDFKIPNSNELVNYVHGNFRIFFG